MVVLLAAVLQYLYVNRKPDLWEEFRSLLEIAHRQGYPTQHHAVYTQSGYLVSVARIQARGAQADAQNGSLAARPVLFIHGLSCDYDIWSAAAPGQILPFQIADRGYDVFVANLRAAKETMRHRERDRESREFWEFSIDELIAEDLPAVLAQVARLNGRKITVVGHSLGGTVALGALAERLPAAEEHIETVISLGSSFNLIGCDSFLTRAFRLVNLPRALQALGLHSMRTRVMYPQAKYLHQLFVPIARLSMDLEGSPLDESRLQVILSVFPAGASLRTYEHLHQILCAQQFRKFDFGEAENLARYGQARAPAYDFARVRAGKFYFLTGEFDNLSHELDVQAVRSQLQGVESHLVRTNNGHLSYIVSQNNQVERFIVCVLEDRSCEY